MMSFESRTYINGSLFRQFANKNVSILLQVDDEAGPNMTGTSTDKKTIRVQMRESLGSRPKDWVEVIGVPIGTDTIRAKEVILFSGDGVDMDEEAYNMMVHFMNNCKDLYKQG